jgi:hypothetical protein
MLAGRPVGAADGVPEFPGHELITAILGAGGHVIARVKEGTTLGFENSPRRGWLPGRSRMTWMNDPSSGKEDQLPVPRPNTT